MKRNFSLVLAILALLVSLFNTGKSALAQQGGPDDKRPPTVVSYQGIVKVGGVPYDGVGYFKFAILNTAGDTSYWSNDGSSSGGGEPTNSVSLTVTSGLFTVLLGDTPMVSLDPFVFETIDRSLRVWFSTDNAHFTQLTPDRKIGMVPFSLQAEEADTLDGWDGAAFALAGHEHDAAYVNDNASEVGDADVALGGLSPNRILGIAWTSYNDGSSSNLDADLLDGQHGANYQARVNGTCAAGSTVQTVNADGTVVCLAAEPRPVFARSIVDNSGNVGYYSSITIGVDGLGLISYYDLDAATIKVAHCNNLACTSASSVTVDSVGNTATRSSIIIGSDGLPFLSYVSTNHYLKVAHCDDLACTTSTYKTEVDGTSADVGQSSSIIIGSDGRPMISYYDATNQHLKTAHCDNVLCSTASLRTIDYAVDVGQYSSIALGSDGLPVIAYRDLTLLDLKVAHCDDTDCSTSTKTAVDSVNNMGAYCAITIGTDGMPIIAYMDVTNANLKVAHCNDLACATPATIHWLGHLDHPGGGWDGSDQLLGSNPRRVESGALQLPDLHRGEFEHAGYFRQCGLVLLHHHRLGWAAPDQLL
jgi:hypothetical protein